VARVLVTLHGGPLDAKRRHVRDGSRAEWFLHPQTDRAYRYSLDGGVWRYDP
jgi:hypothetical protein